MFVFMYMDNGLSPYVPQIKFIYAYCMMCVLLKLALTDIFCVKFLFALTIDH